MGRGVEITDWSEEGWNRESIGMKSGEEIGRRSRRVVEIGRWKGIGRRGGKGMRKRR